MAKIEIPRQIRSEDFPSEYTSLVNKLSMLITPFMSSVYYVLDGRVDSINLNRQIATFRAVTNASGQLSAEPNISINSKLNRVVGAVTLSVTNITYGTYMTNTPFIQGVYSDGKYTIKNITNLEPNTEYSFTIELIGN